MSSYSPFKFTPPLLIESHFAMRRPKREEDVVNIHLCRNVVKNDEKNSAIVELKVQLNKEGDKEKEDACFVAEVTLQSIFTWPDDMDKTFVNSLLTVNAASLLISYARPIIVQLTAASPIPAYNIPFLNMNEIFKNVPID